MTREEALKILKARDDGMSLHKFELALECIIELLDSEPQELEESIALVNEYNLRPYRDGDAWCILLGKDIQSGICGFGYTQTEAYLDFLRSYKEYNHPIGELLAELQNTKGLDEAANDGWALYEYRESPKGLYSTCYIDGFKSGAEWMAEQGETVEGEIVCAVAYPHENKVIARVYGDYRFGDKVIVQIRKADEKG